MKCEHCGKDYPSKYYFTTSSICNECFHKLQSNSSGSKNIQCPECRSQLVSEQAIQLCRENNIKVIPGGCPMMFCELIDIAHKCLRWLLNLTGGFPKQV